MAKKALVISGGGSKGAFAVGVLKYIHQNVMPIDQFDLYCGTSTGSLIVPFAAMGDIGELEILYTTTVQKDVLIEGGILNLVTEVSLHDAKPLKKLIENHLTTPRFNQIVAQNKAIFLSTVCLQTEKLVFWATKPSASTIDYEVQPILTQTDLQRAMLASSCQPVFMQPIEVIAGATPLRQYVDGGVREITPLQIAIDNGATDIIAISLSPKVMNPISGKVTKGIGMLERTIDMFSEDIGANDYRIPNLHLDANRYLASVKANLKAGGLSQATIDQAFGQANNPFASKPIMNLYEIRPDKKLEEGGPGGLTFDPTKMKGMLDKGLKQAKAFFEALPVPPFV